MLTNSCMILIKSNSFTVYSYRFTYIANCTVLSGHLLILFVIFGDCVHVPRSELCYALSSLVRLHFIVLFHYCLTETKSEK